MNVVITPGPMIIKKSEITTLGYHLWATYFLQCKRDYKSQGRQLSPMPYYLLCHAIELEIKSKLLNTINGLTTKKLQRDFGHNLVKAYNTLPSSLQKLTKDEFNILTIVSNIYDRPNKGFEYPDIVNIMFRFSNLSNRGDKLPDIELLDCIASKLIGN